MGLNLGNGVGTRPRTSVSAARTVKRKALQQSLHLRLGRALCLAALLAVGATGCASAADYTLLLRNDSGRTLRAYPVVTTPPPPHREANSAGDVPNGQVAELFQPGGFNPAYANMFFDLDVPNGLLVQLDLESEPAVILVRVFHLQTAWGTEDNDPNLQPQHLFDRFFEVTPGTWELQVPQNFDVDLIQL